MEENRDILESMTQALIKYETISSEQIDQLMARQPVSDPEGWVDDQDQSPTDDVEGKAAHPVSEADTNEADSEQPENQESDELDSDENGKAV